MATYVLIHPAAMADALEAYAPLVRAFALREPGAEEVLLDALHEAGGELITTWPKARKAHERASRLNLFWVGSGRIRQSVLTAPAWSTRLRRGWRELPATARVRRAARRKS